MWKNIGHCLLYSIGISDSGNTVILRNKVWKAKIFSVFHYHFKKYWNI